MRLDGKWRAKKRHSFSKVAKLWKVLVPLLFLVLFISFAWFRVMGEDAGIDVGRTLDRIPKNLAGQKQTHPLPSNSVVPESADEKGDGVQRKLGGVDAQGVPTVQNSGGPEVVKAAFSTNSGAEVSGALMPRLREHLIQDSFEDIVPRLLVFSQDPSSVKDAFERAVKSSAKIREQLATVQDYAKRLGKVFVFKETGKTDLIYLEELYKPLETLHPDFLEILSKWTSEFLVPKLKDILTLRGVSTVEFVVWSTARYRGEQLALLKHRELGKINGPVAENSTHELGLAVDIDIFVVRNGERIRLWQLAESKSDDELTKIAKEFFSGADPYLVRWLNDKPHVSIMTTLAIKAPKLLEKWDGSEGSITAIYGRYIDYVMKNLNRGAALGKLENMLRSFVGKGRYFGSM